MKVFFILYFILFSFLFGINSYNVQAKKFLGQSYKVYELSNFYQTINAYEISKEDSEKLISKLKQILERYVYLDILKKPLSEPVDYYK